MNIKQKIKCWLGRHQWRIGVATVPCEQHNRYSHEGVMLIWDECTACGKSRLSQIYGV